ncbi:MAG: hypothetical protein JWM59_4423 [Verrucomicrobiales bacterium]|nr:hypothetical protein [Verrucomicrobiales bacterium]
MRPKTAVQPPYPNREELLTWSRFWKGRFLKEMVRSNMRTDGVRLEAPGALCVFYRENADSIRMDLSGLKASLRVVAVDTRAPWREIVLEGFTPAPEQVFHDPRRSDWAIAPGQAGKGGIDPVAGGRRTFGPRICKW